MTPNQADREAFKAIFGMTDEQCDFEGDDAPTLAILAAHRRAALEEAARVAESLIPMPGSIKQMHGTPAQAVFEAAQAIRALIDKEPT